MSDTTPHLIHPALINFEKTDSHQANLFFGQQLGLMDTINKHYPDLERLYKRLKALDWDEMEFYFEPCRLEFSRMAPQLSQPMINQIGWQWETDTMAARTITPVMSGFLTDQTAFDLYQRIGDNEVVHGRTYSEIVKFSFADPEKVMADVLGVKEHKQRLNIVAKVFHQAYVASHELALGIRKRDQETFEIFFLFVVALLIMERGQFMSSFPITFIYGENEHFVPICKAVQKICQDEYEIHAGAGAMMINHMRDTGEGITAMFKHRDLISRMLHEVRNLEVGNLNFLFGGNENLFGVTQRDISRWIDFTFADIADVLSTRTEFTAPKSNPLSYMTKWVNITGIQAALQEEKNGAYMLGMMRRDDLGQKFEVAGLLD
jgi:ribonucleoside-diphosphate reductase beta chain